tara:strand:+ start:7253 stop:7795 length:543 start_codon:yes stop_codon:yes gene_type:complete
MKKFALKYEFDIGKDKMWEAYRDHLVEIGNRISFVEKIEVLSREEKDNKTVVENVWDTSGKIPSGIKNFLPDSLFKYSDNALWDNKNYFLEFENSPVGGSRIYEIKGEVKFDGDERRTVITQDIEIELNVLDNLPALKKVPSFMQKKIIDQMTKFFEGEAKKNLKIIIDEVYRFASRFSN